MRRSELIMWYLEQREADISEEDLDYENLLITKVIKKLLKTVSFYISSLYDNSTLSTLLCRTKH